MYSDCDYLDIVISNIIMEDVFNEYRLFTFYSQYSSDVSMNNLDISGDGSGNEMDYQFVYWSYNSGSSLSISNSAFTSFLFSSYSYAKPFYFDYTYSYNGETISFYNVCCIDMF